MRLLIYVNIFSISLITIISQGCSSRLLEQSSSHKALVQNDMYLILTDEQYKELGSLTTDNEINNYVDNFWKEKDIELKNEYTNRLKYANLHFPDLYGWGRSDRKRIYLTYGPPTSIDRTNFADLPLDVITKARSIEIWYYSCPGKNNSLNTLFTDVSKGEMKFVFADMTGSGFYKIIDSSENPGDIDSRIFQ
ncbi:MAG: GWxTD domain-containing protein [Ignavibacteriaceae bacterium]|nr:GWxTD domain-containing protein [Ignavibacteriaceae bacterium]